MLKQLKYRLQVGLLLSVQIFSVGALFAAEKPSWQADWETTIQAAKKEAQIFIYAAIGPYHPRIFAEFQVAYPEIFFVEGPEYMDVKPALKIVDDALAGKPRAH